MPAPYSRATFHQQALEHSALTRTTADHAAVQLERTIPAPPHAVYQAWLDPDLVRRWLAPVGLEVTKLEIDARVGGRYRVWQAHRGIDVGGFECELVT